MIINQSAALIFVLTSGLLSAPLRVQSADASPLPYPTGSHLQMVRRFFTAADGLPGDDIRAITVTRDNVILVASSNGVARLEGERWLIQTGPAEASALFAPGSGSVALAGSTNGVWALSDGEWKLE